MRFLIFGFVLAFTSGEYYSSRNSIAKNLITGSAILLTGNGVNAKKTNPWKKTVGKATKKKAFHQQVIEDIKKKSISTYSWILKKIKKSEFNAQNIIATQIFAAGKNFISTGCL